MSPLLTDRTYILTVCIHHHKTNKTEQRQYCVRRGQLVEEETEFDEYTR